MMCRKYDKPDDALRIALQVPPKPTWDAAVKRLESGDCLCSFGFGLPRRFRWFSGDGDISSTLFKALKDSNLLARQRNPGWKEGQSYKFEWAWFLTPDVLRRREQMGINPQDAPRATVP
jgi:hypothetical protein